MWPKVGCSSISMTEFIIPQFYKDLTRKKNFFEGCPWFELNNLGLAPGMSLKFFTAVAKSLKLKVRKFLGLITTREKLVQGGEGGEGFDVLVLSFL